jgi:integrative and conjugative element protein (TIGR02256 family)
MTVESDRHAPRAETGGLVIGYWVSSTEAVVTHVTMPGPNAQRSADRFVPDQDHDVAIAEFVWHQSEGASAYLGDWHSHPVSDGGLSGRDRTTLGRIARSPDAFAASPLMLVLAKPRHGWELVAWRATTNRFAWFQWMQYDRLVVRYYERSLKDLINPRDRDFLPRLRS